MSVNDLKCPLRNLDVIVMVRAFRDEPVRLNVVELREDIVELAGNDPANTIGFPKERVYVYDESSFQALICAFEAADEAVLRGIWGQATQYDEIRET